MNVIILTSIQSTTKLWCCVMTECFALHEKMIILTLLYVGEYDARKKNSSCLCLV